MSVVNSLKPSLMLLGQGTADWLLFNPIVCLHVAKWFVHRGEKWNATNIYQSSRNLMTVIGSIHDVEAMHDQLRLSNKQVGRWIDDCDDDYRYKHSFYSLFHIVPPISMLSDALLHERWRILLAFLVHLRTLRDGGTSVSQNFSIPCPMPWAIGVSFVPPSTDPCLDGLV